MTAKFIKSEDGAITVDWTVISAGLVGLSMAAGTVMVPAINDGAAKLSFNIGGYSHRVQDYTDGSTGFLFSSLGRVEYTLSNEGTQSENGTELNYKNNLVLDFKETLTRGVRVETKPLQHYVNGPQFMEIRIDGGFPDLEGMIERGEIVTNIPPRGFFSGTYRGRPYAHLDQRYVTEDSYFEIRVPIDSIDFEGVVHNDNRIVVDVSAL